MRLTLEPTATSEWLRPEHRNPRVIIEVDSDDLTMDEVVDTLLRPALLGWGFGEATVNEVLGA
jgi:hypothetical protein